MPEACAQAAPAAGQQGFHRFNADPENFRRVDIAAALIVAEQDRGPLARRQGIERRLDRLRKRCILERAFGAGCGSSSERCPRFLSRS